MQIIDVETAKQLKDLKTSSTHEDKLTCALSLGCNIQTVDKYLSGKGKNLLTAKAIIDQLTSTKTV